MAKHTYIGLALAAALAAGPLPRPAPAVVPATVGPLRPRPAAAPDIGAPFRTATVAVPAKPAPPRATATDSSVARSDSTTLLRDGSGAAGERAGGVRAGGVRTGQLSAPPDSAAGAPVRVSDEEQERLKRILTDISRRRVTGGKRRWENQKTPRVALLSSALLPGLGQVYNGRRLKVAIMVGAMSFYVGNAIQDWRRHTYYRAKARTFPELSNARREANVLSDFYEESAIDFLWWSGGSWLLGMIDAWIDAHLYDVRGYTPEVPHAPATNGPKRVQFSAGARGGTRYLVLGFGFE